MKMTYNIDKIATAALVACLQCPLCNNLIQEATTISECLHTFCKDCIYEELDDGDGDCCPVCNVNLGGSPLEKLRADRQLDDIRMKLFLTKSKKRRSSDADLDEDAMPIKRKERSLASLGIGLASCLNPGFIHRETKPVSCRSTVAVTNTDTDESEDGNLMLLTSDTESEGEDYIKDTDSCTSSRNIDECISLKKGSDGEGVINEETLVHKIVKLASAKKALLCEEESRKIKKGCSNFVKEKVSSAEVQFHKTDASQRHVALHVNEKDHKVPTMFAAEKPRGGKCAKKQSALAQLADIAVCQEVNSASISKCSTATELEEGQQSQMICGAGKLRQQNSFMTNAASSFGESIQPFCRSNGDKDKVSETKNLSSHDGLPQNCIVLPEKLKKQNTGIWFILQPGDAQMTTNQNPRISSQYMRVRDSKVPISVVKKYLVKKLRLKNENDVEITCRGEPLVSDLSLETAQEIWLADMQSIVVPSTKHDCAEDYLMVLKYVHLPV